MVAADHVSLRRNNLSVVLRHVRDVGPRSRARIAADTGLNKATVSSLVAELVERGLLREGQAESDAAPSAAPANSSSSTARGVCGVGAEINVDYLAVTALDLSGEIVTERRVPLDVAHLDPGTTLDHLAELIREAVAAVVRPRWPDRRRHARRARSGPERHRFAQAGPEPRLGKRSRWSTRCASGSANPSYPVRVDNEANLAALAAYSEFEKARADPRTSCC